MKLDYSFLNNKAKEVFEEILSYETELYLEGAKATESPIEQILWLSLVFGMKDMHGFYPFPQKEFELNRKKYIADIAIEIPGTQEYVCIVECDGHEFHERTKEQAKKDRSRDRAFQAAGIPVFRFTGSEIYADPQECAREVTNFLRKLLHTRER